jgi:hypothetical protein
MSGKEDSMRNVSAWILVGLTLIGLGACRSAQARTAGTYVHRDNREEFFELDKDGSFFLREGGVGYEGEWDVEGDVITFRYPAWDMATRCTIEGNTVACEGGDVWVKQGDSQAKSRETTNLAGMYYREGDPDEYLELRADSSFEAGAPTGETYAGTWSAERNTVILKFALGQTLELERNGNSLSSEGVIYTRD